jgi:DNA polymerase III alpha subunit
LKKYIIDDLKLSEESIVKTKSIFYKNEEDFKAYLTFKCINKRTTLSKPNIDHMCSNEFSFESWNEKVQNN